MELSLDVCLIEVIEQALPEHPEARAQQEVIIPEPPASIEEEMKSMQDFPLFLPLFQVAQLSALYIRMIHRHLFLEMNVYIQWSLLCIKISFVFSQMGPEDFWWMFVPVRRSRAKTVQVKLASTKRPKVFLG